MNKIRQPIFDQICVVGLGLIGASFVQALVQANQDTPLMRRIVAVDSNERSIRLACQAGLIAEGHTDLSQVAQGSDLIVLATPVQSIPKLFAQIHALSTLKKLPEHCIISDVGSTKADLLQAARQIFGQHHRFIGGHPIAGAENSGFEARKGDLFVRHKLILCPDNHSDAKDIQKLQALWQALGADVVLMSSDRHDQVLAYTSHLPHLLAFSLTHQLAEHDDNLDILRYAAGGFRDFSRIAASDPQMWHDIFLANKTAILQALDEFSAHLGEFRQLIHQEQSQSLLAWLGKSRDVRRHFGHMLTSHDTSHHSSTHQDIYMTNQSYHIKPAQSILGTITVPGDKSISHRSIMFGSLADGVTKVSGFLQGEDALATLQAFSDMGVKIEREGDQVVIHGVGIDGLNAPNKPLYMGNSGTSMRLLAGILSAQQFDSVMTGDVSLSKRPMERVAKPLRQMGAIIQSTGEKGTAPLSITGGQSLTAIDYTLPVASAQIKSCLILAALWAKGTTTITEPEISRDHTERMLNAFNYPVHSKDGVITVTGGGRLTACDIIVPADISSAAFFMVLAAIGQGEGLTIKKVGMNPTRTGVIDILTLMGADISITNETVVGGEPIADIIVKPSQLMGIDIPEHLVPLAIDEFPVLFVAASCAIGKTTLTGAKELRVKESDRIAVMAEGLTTLGIECEVLDDGMIIHGKGKAGETTAIFGGGVIESHHDHRIAMSFAVASVRASDDIIIHGTQTVNTSFPNFANLANQVGLNIQVIDE
ncbi:bifunctional prephenate dehydrogenase/3-phosphoshikimate 1-carboxyvinyltransferase [Moraxella nasicaprae]|uniref:3-phosphoshikimate 1-carboxyvinyltransferase n=1 Tax=Moraxella nasicaprae TaxID=2904122 RepID=A0ABY6F3T5_9GAMM|nr:bifunctional prephenate dehydrogenase/3-phosphoshikimate 1-carboxyvinyltransferase [Moraxella nasicaprae]UXZ04740.1 bifunctional prephenate dehydrogenase/3-phosphoshikimate 1-carboxyvinyltransferase [Moraxella nasicaprae]